MLHLPQLMAGGAGHLLDEAGLPPSEVRWWLENARHRRFRAGEAFCEIGQRTYDFAILRSGIVQVYGLTGGGDRVVLDFVFPGGAVMALDAAIRGIASEVVIEMVTGAELWIWPYELRLASFGRHPGWQRLEVLYLEQAFVRKHRRYKSLRTETSRERFARLHSELPPEWVQIPQGLVASYLDITPQYLSRLRAERRKQAG
ncbi:Crp/Fnr family transcriptional regulator [Sphingomonas sp.]|uniref:Crp/Fnr family transcriptional regulator n=1 Tax=Sphingomonas sp. TaxID=28214 RepID=UPI001B2E0ADC|nr:Crp/Fnr family transcriptional regulator [Sphingomonas sp.]MBO9713834.1 Crp/Fnr family transcriptional regulator [Sphingomonas sp.]